MGKESGIRLIANNKKAYHDYFIEDTYEAGIELAGTEVITIVKSVYKNRKGDVFKKHLLFYFKLP